MSYQTYLSNRGIPLVYILPPQNKPVLTVENYLKWYDLYLVLPNGEVEKVRWGQPEEVEFEKTSKESAQSDHVFNPRFADFLCEKRGYTLCDQSREILIGRWETEYKSTY